MGGKYSYTRTLSMDEVLGLAEKLYAGKETWSSGLRAVALGQLRLLSRIYQFTKGNQLITVTASPGTQAAT